MEFYLLIGKFDGAARREIAERYSVFGPHPLSEPDWH
jgi:hypothetical protein